MTLDYPWSIDRRGRTAATSYDEHIRDLVEQVLLTAPGERVMRPDFGAGLLAMVFEPGGPEAAISAQYLVQSALDQVLSDLLTTQQVTVDVIDSALLISVDYIVLRTRTPGVATVRLPGGSA